MQIASTVLFAPAIREVPLRVNIAYKQPTTSSHKYYLFKIIIIAIFLFFNVRFNVSAVSQE